jgi:hypothetical protein
MNREQSRALNISLVGVTINSIYRQYSSDLTVHGSPRSQAKLTIADTGNSHTASC